MRPPSMRIAFYAPMKPPTHPRPSGDRRIARLLMAALESAGCAVELVSELRTWEGKGNRAQQDEIERNARTVAEQFIAECRQRRPSARPQCWFTYHPYHKSPDWLGVRASAALGIPYVVAEASLSDRQQHGDWARGDAQTRAAIRQAQLIVNINSNDLAGVLPQVRADASVVRVKPFADVADVSYNKAALRDDIQRRFRIDANQYWLLCVAMMREGDKFESYKRLADAVGALQRDDWRLLIVGGGAAQHRVNELFESQRPERVHFFGECRDEFIYTLMRACDLFVWPAYNEALGMAALEAIACRLPVVAGRSGGIGDVIVPGKNGVLVDAPTAANFAAQIEQLLDAPAHLAQLSATARIMYDQHHHITRAAEVLGAALEKLRR